MCSLAAPCVSGLAGAWLPPEVTPLRAPRLSALPQFQGEHRERTLWGTYRPGLYLGAMDSDRLWFSFPGRLRLHAFQQKSLTLLYRRVQGAPF